MRRTPRRSGRRVGQIPEDYQQTTENKFLNVRGTVQLTEGHTAWVKYYRSPTDGFVVDYWGATLAGEREALTAQNQTAKNWAAQWSGVLRDNWSMEAAFADYSSQLFVTTFEDSGRLANAPIENQADDKYYNGATFDGFIDRPRQQFNVASNWFLTPGGKSHDIKVGFDFQNMESGARVQVSQRAVLRCRDLQPGDRRDRCRIQRLRLPDRPLDLDRQDVRALRARQVPGDRSVLRRSRPALGETDRRQRHRHRHGRHQRHRAAPVRAASTWPATARR